MVMPEEILAIKEIAKANTTALYQDAAQPAVRVLGNTLAQCTSLFATPIGRICEIFVKNIHRYINKLEGLTEEQITNPDTRILVPILEKMRYTDDELVADYYAQILATASTKDSAKSVSIAFIEILNRLSADELKMLEYINSPDNSLILVNKDGVEYLRNLKGVLPVINVHIKLNTGGYYVATKNLSYILDRVTLDSPDNYNLYIDNMIALGLIIKPAMIRQNDDNVYEYIKETQKEKIYKIQSGLVTGRMVDFAEARIELTTLGSELIRVGSNKQYD